MSKEGKPVPVHMRQIASGKDKGKWIVEDDSGKRALGPTTREHARAYTSARNIADLRAKGDPRAPRKPKGK